MQNFKGPHFPADIIILNVYWYLRNALSYRVLEEVAKDSFLGVDHFTQGEDELAAGNVWFFALSVIIAAEP